MASLEVLPPLKFAGGFNALDLWPLTNLVLIPWTLLIVAPKWKYTPTLTLVSPLIQSLLYTLVLVSLMTANADEPQPDFTKLEGIVQMFQDPSVVFGGWLHYCVHDALVGRWILLDSVERGASTKFHIVVMIPLLVLACMLSPIGWLVYMAIVRPFLLPLPTTEDAKKQN